ncbi:hypothetical protein PF011_g20668 [Phytophthora fragariae]|uniref:Uncharacterized protein n=1 Tax=Phytophthora fragariae TaxID=53985 RepID=A0A6A3IS46_9STRA|nr:hypothetical protein PF003_g30509 [Phytophthora fragariae]KAE8984717.1 hypothetical protein PF011_g20668 [Phytophthora fragariae]
MRASYVLLAQAISTKSWVDNGNKKIADGDEDASDDEERGFSLRAVLGLKKASPKVLSMEKIPLPPNYFAMDDLVKMTKDWNFKIDKFEEWYCYGTLTSALTQFDSNDSNFES